MWTGQAREGGAEGARALLQEPELPNSSCCWYHVSGPVSEVCVHTAPSHCLVFADFFGCMLCNQGHINWYMKSKLNM